MAAIKGRLTVQSIDGNKVPKSTAFQFSTASGLIADSLLFAAALAPLYDAVIEGQITQMQLSYGVALPGGLKAGPVVGSNNTIGALLDYDTVVPLEETSEWIPSFLTAGYDPTHQNLVLQSQAAVAPFLAFLLATTNTTVLTDEDFNALSALTRAIKSDRRQRRALGRLR